MVNHCPACLTAYCIGTSLASLNLKGVISTFNSSIYFHVDDCFISNIENNSNVAN